MLSHVTTTLCVLVSLATAHFSIEYPEMRGDSFATGASQYIYPCANVNQTANTNRTIWPLTGGSLNLDLHHPWTYVFINLGLGTDYPSLNISLTPEFLNATGNGTLCLPEVKIPASVNVKDGQNATLQVVTLGETGSALYNCADITFSSKGATLDGDKCKTNGVTVAAIKQQVNGSSTTSSPSSTESGANPSSTKASAAVSGREANSMLVAGAVAGMGAVVVSWLL
ncbi:uncharacterized protein BP5553_05750 [Venustampulla echinocandica]|uniref:Copper acquisition factor BIM1-like domain-containing protein n=1 Tax=Venustampulla echinocandica TaxID=2656787 RepID=A0A370TLJ7_9HELO|nr:uncharacterized protein BP5553_05750 [Venustampulla echinocandica]RDL36398.1 hypothetical protein BP5553_05750 [Venustampulla echinocandica]